MHDYYSETSLRASFGNVQLSEMNRPAVNVGLAGRDGLTLDLAGDVNKRSRVISLSDLAFEALSPVYSTATIEGGTKTGTQTMTPTPTQFLFPRSVTAEQEAYASGFAMALEEIYRTQGRPTNDVVNLNSGFMSTAGNCGVWQPSAVNQTSTLHYIPESSVSSSSCGMTAQVSSRSSTTGCQPMTSSVPPHHMFSDSTGLNRSNISSQCTGGMNPVSCFTNAANSFAPAFSTPVNVSSFSCVPTVCSSLYMPPKCFSPVAYGSSSRQSLSDSSTSPKLAVDMQEQDRWRLERKRAKNRVAAARCQMRKLERITKLEDKARDLRNYNAQLSQTAKALHEHVAKLQKQILSHTEHGCRLLIPSLQ